MKVRPATILITLLCTSTWFATVSLADDSKNNPATTVSSLDKALGASLEQTPQHGYDEAIPGATETQEARPLTVDDIVAGRISENEIRHRPFLYFRRWANKPLRIVPMSFFVFVLTVILGEAIKNNLAVAREIIRRQFWRSFGTGMASVLLVLSFVRPLFISDIGSPLALLIIALVELLLLFGLSVTVSLIGETCMKRVTLAGKFAQRPLLYRLSTAAVGTIVVGLIMALPGIGILPPIGIRLVLLFCMLGSGSLLKSRFGTVPIAPVND